MFAPENRNMGTFHELKKQASFFLKDKIRTARLALTDVTPAQLLTEEATNGSPWGPDARTMGVISRAAFEVDDYWRIVEVLHNRLLRFDRKRWREPYQALVLMEHLLTHGPESVASEFQSDIDVIREMENFQYIDERGFNWGFAVRKKSERILKLLEKGPVLKEERARARKLTRGIQGFGSFNHRSSSSANGSFREANLAQYGRWNSHPSESESQEISESAASNRKAAKEGNRDDGETHQLQILVTEGMEDLKMVSPDRNQACRRNEIVTRPPLKEKIAELNLQKNEKENIVPMKKVMTAELQHWEGFKETNPLLGRQEEETKIEFPTEDHPFTRAEPLANASLLSVS